MAKKPEFYATLEPGKLLTIWGQMRAGKSSLACDIMDKASNYGYNMYTNMHFFPKDRIQEAIDKDLLLKGVFYKTKPQEIKTVLTGYDLLKNLTKTPSNIVVMDEMGLITPSSLHSTKQVRWFKSLVYTIGKLNASLILIGQDKGSIIPALRETLVNNEVRVYRQGKRRYADIYRLDRGNEKFIKRMTPISPTKLPFDSKGLIKFEFDLDVMWVFNEFANYNSLDLVKKAPIILDEARERFKEQNTKKPKKETKTDISFKNWLKFPNDTLSENAERSGCGTKTSERAKALAKI